MAIGLKFNFKDLISLDNDLEASKKAIPVIAAKVLTARLRQLRAEMRPQIPKGRTGALRRSFSFPTIRPSRSSPGTVRTNFGFMRGRAISAGTAIAANVLQKGGATPKKGKYLWIPLSSNRNADGTAMNSPRDLIAAGGFVAVSKAGNKIAFLRSGIPAFILKQFVRLPAPPVPIEARLERAAPEIAADITETIAQVVEAKKTVINALNE